jgi:hypothetical protein
MIDSAVTVAAGAVAFVMQMLSPLSCMRYHLRCVHIVAFVVCVLLFSPCMCCHLCCMHVVTFIACVLSPLSHVCCHLYCAHAVAFVTCWGAFNCVAEPVAAWIVRQVIIADAAVAIAASCGRASHQYTKEIKETHILLSAKQGNRQGSTRCH